MSLAELIEQHDELFYPEDITHEILDDLQFMVHDLDMQILGYVCAKLSNTTVDYEPDMVHWGRIQSKIMVVTDLSPEEEQDKGRLLAWMQSLQMLIHSASDDSSSA